jgi:peptide/nickel transport system substrate-binding protein
VKFHDGAEFNADDVVFSIERALAPTSKFKPYVQGVVGAKKVDNLTVDIITNGPAPTLIAQLTEVRIMDKEWCAKNNVLKPLDFTNKEETFATRNANGTGPYILKSREIDVKTVFSPNPNWWGLKAGKMEGNISEIVYTPIKSDATRAAALLSGQLDFVLDPPVQDIARLKEDKNVTILEGNENRTIFLGMDQGRDELLYSSVKGKNPFKDKRVREAFQLAIDVKALQTTIMRGLSSPTSLMVAPQVDGYTKELDRVVVADRAKAKKLMADAGYPQGFEITLDGPNNRYINDEKLMVAIAGMLAQIDVKVKVNAMPRAQYFPKLDKRDVSFYLYGWGVPTFDALYSLQSLIRTHVDKSSDGDRNYVRYSNPKVDALIDALKTETNADKRKKMSADVLGMVQADIPYITLHHQVIPWAMRANVSTTHRADNRFHAKWTKIN